MFITYSLLINDQSGKTIKEYIGKGRDRTKTDRGRLQEHYGCIQMALRGTLKRNIEFYNEFAQAIRSGQTVTHAIHQHFEHSDDALQHEKELITSYTEPDVILLNRLYKDPFSDETIVERRDTKIDLAAENKHTRTDKPLKLAEMALNQKAIPTLSRNSLTQRRLKSIQRLCGKSPLPVWKR